MTNKIKFPTSLGGSGSGGNLWGESHHYPGRIRGCRKGDPAIHFNEDSITASLQQYTGTNGLDKLAGVIEGIRLKKEREMEEEDRRLHPQSYFFKEEWLQYHSVEELCRHQKLYI